MTPQELLDYVRSTMSMQHIHQPVLLRAPGQRLGGDEQAVGEGLRAGGREIPRPRGEAAQAHAAAGAATNGVVVRQANDVWSLDVGRLRPEDREVLRLECEARLRDFVINRAFWRPDATRMPSGTPGEVFRLAD